MLGHLLDRLQVVPSLDLIVVATTPNVTDDLIADYAKATGTDVFRGSEPDVMNRVIGAACLVNADVIAEITADCPIIDPDIIE